MRTTCLALYSLFFFAMHSVLPATETMPWFGNVMEFEFRSSYTFRHYDSVDSRASTGNYSSDDHLLNLSLALSPVTQWTGEVELLVTRTSEQGFSVSHLKATGRYLWTDDIIGDPVSLTTGASLTVPVKTSQQDISLGYHGDVEAEIHAALGKEITSCSSWLARGWAVASVGIANLGSPWVAFETSVEGNCNDCHYLRGFVVGRWGIGDKDLDVTKEPFPGYSRIDHRSIDVGVRYSYRIDYCGVLSIEFGRRVLARNFPEDVSTYTITYFWPFSL